MFAKQVHDELVDKPVTSNKIIKTNNVDGMTSITSKGVAAVVFERKMPEKFQNWINNLAADQLPSIREIVAVEQTEEMLQEKLDSVDLSAAEEVDYLINDANTLAKALAEILYVSFVRIRFDVVDSNACRLFHIDQVPARLICAYRGRGTQYGVKNDQDEPEHIHEIETGELVLLRGTQWKNDLPSGIVHRSPPIEGTGETRFVLVIDPIKNPAEEA